MIVVTGASGTNGRHVVAELLDRGADVRALVLANDLNRSAVDSRAEVMIGNLDQPDRLNPIFERADALFLLTANGPNQVAQETGLVDAAVAAGVRRIVKFSANGAGSDDPDPIAKLHRSMEDHLKASGADYTMLRNNFFMQNLLWFAQAIAATGHLALPMGTGTVAMVDVRDIARVAATVLLEPGHSGATYTITGPEALGFADVAGRLSRALGRPIIYDAIDGPSFHAELGAWGLDPDFADALVATYLRLAHGSQSEVTSTVEWLGRQPPRDLDDFIASNIAAFAPAPSPLEAR